MLNSPKNSNTIPTSGETSRRYNNTLIQDESPVKLRIADYQQTQYNVNASLSSPVKIPNSFEPQNYSARYHSNTIDPDV